MKALVTGTTGKVGHAIASALLDRGDGVRALVRDPKRAASILPAGIEPIRGDVTDPDSLAAAVEGCELVFNAMGMPEQWVRDEGIFDNLGKTRAETNINEDSHTVDVILFFAGAGNPTKDKDRKAR